jgi:hypothetical protein
MTMEGQAIKTLHAETEVTVSKNAKNELKDHR